MREANNGTRKLGETSAADWPEARCLSRKDACEGPNVECATALARKEQAPPITVGGDDTNDPAYRSAGPDVKKALGRDRRWPA